ncbi:MAG: aminotransferase class III-fold pyridoxal phosphate-dependent enzyme [Rhodobacteraceae bacterium]|nr:aminotransferase class III-fold pyridoxal phosphate-dependent enzyme [Paracoccaceae bacterium]
MRFELSRRLIAENAAFVAGGVNSNFRLGMAPGPLVFERGEGPFLHDVDGNRLIDYYCGMGAAILGHAPAAVARAVAAQVEQGFLLAGQTAVEFEAARILCARIPAAGRLRFSTSGSEAVQAAMRLARVATGRRVIVKFEGHYHGWFDNILWSAAPALNAAGPAEAPVAVAGSTGQEAGDAAGLAILGWNDLAPIEARLARGDVAAVMMEPAMCNQGAIAPAPGFLEGVRAACDRHGALLVFDEVITGFRLGVGGGQGLYGVTPDLAVFAKAIANGFPVAAIVGRADLMELFVRGGAVHGGTYNAQPAAMAATVATQGALTAEGYARAGEQGLRLQEGVRRALAGAGIAAEVAGFPLVFHVAFGLERPARNFRDIARGDRAGYARFAHLLLERGVRVLERGTWFMSFAHDGAVVDATLAAVGEAARAYARG